MFFLQDANENKGYLLGTQRVFDRYVQKLEEADNPPCPLCHRFFEKKDEIQSLIEEARNVFTITPPLLILYPALFYTHLKSCILLLLSAEIKAAPSSRASGEGGGEDQRQDGDVRLAPEARTHQDATHGSREGDPDAARESPGNDVRNELV